MKKIDISVKRVLVQVACAGLWVRCQCEERERICKMLHLLLPGPRVACMNNCMCHGERAVGTIQDHLG